MNFALKTPGWLNYSVTKKSLSIQVAVAYIFKRNKQNQSAFEKLNDFDTKNYFYLNSKDFIER